MDIYALVGLDLLISGKSTTLTPPLFHELNMDKCVCVSAVFIICFVFHILCIVSYMYECVFVQCFENLYRSILVCVTLSLENVKITCT